MLKKIVLVFASLLVSSLSFASAGSKDFGQKAPTVTTDSSKDFGQ